MKASDYQKTSSRRDILFVNLHIKKSRESFKITFINKTWSSGLLKAKDSELGPGRKLNIDFLDRNKNVIETVTIRNPLYISAEHFSADGEIHRKSVEVNEAYIPLRVQISKAVTFVRIEEEGGDQISLLKL